MNLLVKKKGEGETGGADAGENNKKAQCYIMTQPHSRRPNIGVKQVTRVL